MPSLEELALSDTPKPGEPKSQFTGKLMRVFKEVAVKDTTGIQCREVYMTASFSNKDGVLEALSFEKTSTTSQQ
ncbi:hypothetical protein RhiXN_11254 [Rhizoctonia solani]|uniref:Uncharacterized protein n=1 Tax=Rhizoctonia solani TaxID=456999 RepID=A0A8H8P9Z6_9AGAM|nr:uncharacterized protein RhiXN_11254 [Rhizoctonia solani]QRW26177.1 hypothetical protein RhiXN_11254 [Rhizoctonia solani]